MERAYGAANFDEEKRLIIEHGESLKGVTNGRQSMEFCQEWAQHASEAVRADREAAAAVLAVFPGGFRDCSEALRNDLDFFCENLLQEGSWVIKSAGPKLTGNKELMLQIVRDHGELLLFSSEELQKDEELVLAAVSSNGRILGELDKNFLGKKEIILGAVKDSGCALAQASPELQCDSEVVLAAVRNEARALEFASEALKADFDFVAELLRTCGDTFAVLHYVSPTLFADKDFILLAVRRCRCYEPAKNVFSQKVDVGIQAALDFQVVYDAAMSFLAVKGESAPTISVTVCRVLLDADQAVFAFKCETTLMSGEQICCEIIDEPKKIMKTNEEDSYVERPEPIVNDIAEMVASSRRPDSEDPEARSSVFILFNKVSGDSIPVSAWDWERPLSDFIFDDK